MWNSVLMFLACARASVALSLGSMSASSHDDYVYNDWVDGPSVIFR